MTSMREQRAAWGRIGGLTAWSRNGAQTMLEPARRGFAARFERAVDPEGMLAPAERAARAKRARRAWMLTLAARSAEVRRARQVPGGSAAKTAADAVKNQPGVLLTTVEDNVADLSHGRPVPE